MAARLIVREQGDEAVGYLHRSRALIERAGRGCDLGIVLRDIGAAHAAADRPGAAVR